MRKIYLGIFVLFLAACSAEKSKTSDPIDQKVDSLLALMTLEEKIGQLTLYTSDHDVTGPTIRAQYKEDIMAGKVGSIFNAVGAEYTKKLQKMAVEQTRLGIPLIFGYDVIHGHRTIFPIPLAEASSWDLVAMKLSAQIAAKEAASQGLHWTFAPMVDISRDPRWGRIMEGAGEDHYLGSLIAKAKVLGFQGDNLADITTVMACMKHYAAYGAPQGGRDYHTVDMSERTLREVYLPPYKAGIDAGAATVMTSFNELDGVPATGSKFLMTDILRNEWGFEGFVVTDYTAIMEMMYHGFAADTAHAAELSINAGTDMDMQAGFYQDKLPALVNGGKVSIATIDESVKRILKKKFELGLFDDPYAYSDVQREKETLMAPAHMEAAKDIARKSIVLLKNDGNILPISQEVKSIAVIGPLADAHREMIGAWSAQGDANMAISILTGLKAKYPNTKITYAKGCEINSADKSGFAEAVKAASLSQIVILSVGEAAGMSGEASSRTDIKLPGVQEDLIKEIMKLNKPTVAVLTNGRPLDVSLLDATVPSILETWFLGTQAGYAIADVIAGDYNPAGKLTVSFPRNLGQIPIHYNMKNTGRPIESDPKSKYTSKYLDVPNSPLYPFGYGLSYTTFEYTAIAVDKESFSVGDSVKVSVKVKNTGARAGEEVVQLYIRDLVGSVTRPVKELKEYRKIALNAGEEKEVVFYLANADLAFYRQDMTFGSEPGYFNVFVGGSSASVLQRTFELK